MESKSTVEHHIGPFGEQISYMDTQAGKETIVWIHGLTDSMHSWQSTISFFRNYYRCILIDLPGHGLSSQGNHTFTVEAYAETVRALLDHLSIKVFHLIGHSLGGHIALYMALYSKSGLQSLSLSAPAGLETFTNEEVKFLIELSGNKKQLNSTGNFQKLVPTFNHYFFKVEHEVQKEMVKKLKQATEKMLANPLQIIQKSMKGMLECPVFDDLHKLKIPVQIFLGLEDKLIPNRLIHHYNMKDLVDTVKHKIPKAEVILYPDCGHMPHLEHSAAYNLQVYKFLNSELYNT